MMLLYISGTYYPAAGGAEISMHTFLKRAVEAGYDTLVATNLEKTNCLKKYIEYDGVSIIGVNHETRKEELSKIIDQYQPDWIITQLMWSDVALQIANTKGIKSILRFCKIPSLLDISESSEFSPTKILAVSDYVKDYIEAKWDRQSILIPPPIELDKIVSKKATRRMYITMFNPNIKKGGSVFKDIASRMPNHLFAVVSGWDILKKGNTIDPEIVKRLCESLRIQYSGQNLDDISFGELQNVRKFPFTENVSEIYARSRIVCIPSQWQEAFGRVSIEAMANSIPVLGSNVGGLSDIVQSGGILIRDFMNPVAWVEELKKLDNAEEYNVVAAKGKQYIEDSYDCNTICNNLFEVFEE